MLCRLPARTLIRLRTNEQYEDSTQLGRSPFHATLFNEERQHVHGSHGDGIAECVATHVEGAVSQAHEREELCLGEHLIELHVVQYNVHAKARTFLIRHQSSIVRSAFGSNARPSQCNTRPHESLMKSPGVRFSALSKIHCKTVLSSFSDEMEPTL